MAKLVRLQTKDQELNRVQDHIVREVNPFLGKEIIDGVLLTNVALTTSATNVYHGLGRKYRGWIVVDNTTPCWVYASVSSDPSKTLSLIATVTTTVSLWVF